MCEYICKDYCFYSILFILCFVHVVLYSYYFPYAHQIESYLMEGSTSNHQLISLIGVSNTCQTLTKNLTANVQDLLTPLQSLQYSLPIAEHTKKKGWSRFTFAIQNYFLYISLKSCTVQLCDKFFDILKEMEE